MITDEPYYPTYIDQAKVSKHGKFLRYEPAKSWEDISPKVKRDRLAGRGIEAWRKRRKSATILQL